MGAIMVLFLFVLMLMNLNKETEPVKSNLVKIIGVIAGGSLLVTLVATIHALQTSSVSKLPNSEIGLVENLGKVLFSEFLLPFELSSILLLSAMVGADLKMDNITSTIQLVPLNHYILLSAIIFTIGVIGVLIRRNAIIIFMSVELMLNAVNLLLAAFSAYSGDASGQVFVFFIMALAAAEVAVGLAIIVMVYRNTSSIDINVLNRLKW
jgi:NADH-quinone oxidoreductase subunit K